MLLGRPSICLEFKLVRDCAVLTIPEAQSLLLKAGGYITVVHAQGLRAIVQTSQGLARLPITDLEALGLEAIDLYAETVLLNQEPVACAPTEALIWESLKDCYDYEFFINIVALGLVYDVCLHKVPLSADSYTLVIKITLPKPGSAMGPILVQDIKYILKKFKKINTICVDFVWEPVWNLSMISKVAKQQLGLKQ